MTKAERIRIAATFLTVAEAMGATIEQRHEDANPGYHGQSIHMYFSLDGVGASVSIDNLHGGNGALISWYNTARPSRMFTAGFNTAVGSSNHVRPHHKATSIGTWDLLAARLQAGLRHARNGTAFLP